MTLSASLGPKRDFSASLRPKRGRRPAVDRKRAVVGRRVAVGGGPAENSSFGQLVAEMGPFRPSPGRSVLRPPVGRKGWISPSGGFFLLCHFCSSFSPFSLSFFSVGRHPTPVSSICHPFSHPSHKIGRSYQSPTAYGVFFAMG